MANISPALEVYRPVEVDSPVLYNNLYIHLERHGAAFAENTIKAVLRPLESGLKIPVIDQTDMIALRADREEPVTADDINGFVASLAVGLPESAGHEVKDFPLLPLIQKGVGYKLIERTLGSRPIPEVAEEIIAARSILSGTSPTDKEQAEAQVRSRIVIAGCKKPNQSRILNYLSALITSNKDILPEFVTIGSVQIDADYKTSE